MRKRLLYTALFVICGITQTTFAIEPATTWQRDDAMAAVSAININEALFEISNILLSGNSEYTLNELRIIESRGDWPMPAREAAIYQFTQSLANLPRNAVPIDVMRHLKEYQARTMVPHQDHESAYVPLFNIRRAAAGVENAWQRNEYAIEAENLLATDPDAWVSGFVNSTNRNLRSAYLDTLNRAELATAMAVQDIALPLLNEKPSLTRVVGITAAMTLDIQAVQQLLIHGQGAGLSSILGNLNLHMPRAGLSALLEFAIQKAPARNASLAITEWWPRLKHEAGTRDLMVETLNDPVLGSSAALALAQSPDIQTLKTLQETAKGESVAAQRAQMALDINRDALLRELQP